ncbi:MAG: FAD-dependent oxidoreductase, partial [Planctomycetes bacterium]|nr:FAD-dependent oxidoreductase [Planctomycetota bacterium]
EKSIAKKAFEKGWVRPIPPRRRTNKQVAIVGGGPAGLACAQQLNRVGHEVTVFEKAPRVGGLLTYGIPEYKLPKELISLRVRQLEEEGVRFRTGATIGKDISWSDLKNRFDALAICIGAEKPRTLPVPGSDLDGIHMAMEYLTLCNSRQIGEARWSFDRDVTAMGKDVIVIGGGDTGSDC